MTMMAVLVIYLCALPKPKYIYIYKRKQPSVSQVSTRLWIAPEALYAFF